MEQKERKKPINRNNILEELFNRQFSIIGKTMDDARTSPNWRSSWCLSEEQYSSFRKESVSLLKKVYKCNKSRAESTFDFFILNFGLTICYEK